MGGKAKLGIVGALNSTIQNIRQKGFEDTIKTNANIEVVGVVDGRNVQDTAMSSAENLFTANPDMEAVYATGEPALIGAVAGGTGPGSGRPDQGVRLGSDQSFYRRHRPGLRGGRGAAVAARYGCRRRGSSTGP